MLGVWKANEKKSRNRKREKKRWSKQESKEKSLSKLRNKILHKTVGRKQFMKAKIHTLSITFLMAFWFVITFICADNFLTYTLLSYLQTIKQFRWRKFKYDLSEITLLSWQREYLTTIFVFRNPKYLCNVLCEFRDPIYLANWRNNWSLSRAVRCNVEIVASLLKRPIRYLKIINEMFL